MAEIANLFTSNTSDTQFSSETFATHVSVTLLANTTYLLLPAATVNATTSTGIICRARVNINSTAQPGSLMEFECQSSNSNDKYSFPYMDVYTTGGSNETMAIEVARLGASFAAVINSAVIVAIDLAELTEGVDYAFGEDDDIASPVTNTTSFADRASVTFTNGISGDDWLVIAWANMSVNASDNMEMRLNRDSDTEVAPLLSEEGEDADDIRSYMLTRVFTLSDTSSHTFKVQVRDDTNGVNDHNISRIFALRLNRFRQHNFDWDESEAVITTADTWQEINSMDVTPDVSGNWLFMGTASYDAGAINRSFRMRFTVAGIAVVGSWESAGVGTTHDTTDEFGGLILGRQSLTTSLQNVDVDIQGEEADPAAVEDRSFVLFSLELAEVVAVGNTYRHPIAPFRHNLTR